MLAQAAAALPTHTLSPALRDGDPRAPSAHTPPGSHRAKLPERAQPRLPDSNLGWVGQDLLHVLGHSDGASRLDFVYEMPQHWSHRAAFCRLLPGAEVFSSPKTRNHCEKH